MPCFGIGQYEVPHLPTCSLTILVDHCSNAVQKQLGDCQRTAGAMLAWEKYTHVDLEAQGDMGCNTILCVTRVQRF